MPIKNNLKERVEQALNEVKPYLEADNGGVELVDCSDKKITIRFLGTCKTCEMQYYTFKSAIEETIKSRVPEIIEIEIVN